MKYNGLINVYIIILYVRDKVKFKKKIYARV